MNFLGIDPGLSGAIALIDGKGKLITLHDTPTITVKRGQKNKNEYLIGHMVTILKSMRSFGNVHCAIENIHSMPGQGVTSMFSMGTGFGMWLGMLAALEIPHTRIEPVIWKRAMKIPGGSEKSASIVIAQRLFPRASLQRKKDHGRADAILLAEHLRRQLETR